MSNTGYDFSAFKLPPAKGQPAPQSGNSPAPDSGSRGYDLSIFNLPAHGPQSTAAKQKPAPAAKQQTPVNVPLTGSNPGNDSRGYNFDVFDLPDRAEIPRGTDGKETETIEIRNFGRHVRANVENALNRSPQEGFNALFRAIGTAQGSQLMSAPALKRFEELGHGFLSSKNPKLFFTTEVVSFLNSLTPEKRRK